MANLEQTAAPLLTPLIAGDTYVRVSPDEQAVMAHWAWKTFLMIELARMVGSRLVPPVEYARYYTERATPPNAYCWVMGLQRRGGRAWFVQSWGGELRIGEEPSDLPDVANGYRGTFAIGHLAFQVIGQINPANELGFRHAGAQGGLIFNIWPGYIGPALEWPPPLFTDEHGLERFAQRQTGREIISPSRSLPLALPPVRPPE